MEIQIGQVQSSYGVTLFVYWNRNTKEIYVGSEYAGLAISKDEAMNKANYYAKTGKIMK